MKRSRIDSLSRLLPRSLQSQLLTRSLLMVAAVLAVVGVLQYLFMKQFVYQNKADVLERQIETVPGNVWERAHAGRGGPPFLFLPGSSIAYIDPNGDFHEIVRDDQAGSVPRFSDDDYAKAAKMPRGRDGRYQIVIDDEGNEQLVVIRRIRTFERQGAGVVQISTRTAPMKQDLLRQSLLFALLSMFALILGLLAYRPVLRKTLVPLSRMVGTMENIDSGRLSERLPAQNGQTEVDRLAHSFNRMLERLEASFHAEQEAKEHMRRFVADASHELRTPLTSIHGFLEVLLRGATPNPDQLHKALRSMHGESERMIKLVRDLLTLAQLDRAPAIQLVEADLSCIVSEMEPQLRLLAGQRDVEFDLCFGANHWFDIDKIKQVILNLFHNAVQHTDAVSGQIRLGVKSDSQSIELSVADNGPGIPREHFPHLIERFYRIDSSRTRRSGGAGLGLSITHAIAELHGGTLTVDSKLGEGSVFRVKIPYQRPKAIP